MTYTAGPDDAPKRLDRLVLQLLPQIPRGGVLKALRTGRIKLNGHKAQGGDRVEVGDGLTITDELWNAGRRPAPSSHEGLRPSPRASGLPKSWIIAQTPDLLVLNKPRGQEVQDQLAPLVKAYLGASSSLSFTPGPLHRLDTNTSGVLCFSASLQGAQEFSRLLQSGGLRKYYLAVLKGNFTTPLHLVSALERDTAARTTRSAPSGKESRTTVTPLVTRAGLTLALCRIETGRTHQIRAQTAEAGYPLAGDGRYGGGAFPGGFILHAWILIFPAPPLDWSDRYEAPVPAESQKSLDACFGASEVHRALARARQEI